MASNKTKRLNRQYLKLEKNFSPVMHKGLKAPILKNTNRIVKAAISIFGVTGTKAEKAVLTKWEKLFIDVTGTSSRRLYSAVFKEGGNIAIDFLAPEQVLSTTGKRVTQLLAEGSLELSTTIAESMKIVMRRELAKSHALQEPIEVLVKRLRKRTKKYTDAELFRLARTETVRASNQGAEEGYRQSGVVEKIEWFNPNPEHFICIELTGKKVKLGVNFKSSGGSFAHPPAHPNCRSNLLPVV